MKLLISVGRCLVFIAVVVSNAGRTAQCMNEQNDTSDLSLTVVKNNFEQDTLSLEMVSVLLVHAERDSSLKQSMILFVDENRIGIVTKTESALVEGSPYEFNKKTEEAKLLTKVKINSAFAANVLVQKVYAMRNKGDLQNASSDMAGLLKLLPDTERSDLQRQLAEKIERNEVISLLSLSGAPGSLIPISDADHVLKRAARLPSSKSSFFKGTLRDSRAWKIIPGRAKSIIVVVSLSGIGTFIYNWLKEDKNKQEGEVRHG